MLPVENPVQCPPNLSAAIKKIGKYKQEAKMYLPICRVLNSISLLVYESLGNSNADAILFHPAPEAIPLNNYLGVSVKSDIHAVVESIDDLKTYIEELKEKQPDSPRRKQWSQLSSAIEVKTKTAPPKELQMTEYAIRLYQYRPDLSTTICLTWKGNKLSVATASSLTINTSLSEKRDIESLLVAYVTTLYNLERTRDKSMSIDPDEGTWKIKVGETYSCYPFYAALPPGRSTKVALGYNDQRRLVVVKECWIPNSSRLLEGPLYEQGHRDGTIAGLARLNHGKVADVSPIGLGDAERIKHRFVLGSFGEPLSQCKTVGHLLMCMYDLVIVHRKLCENDVLHRDISWRNTLCNPSHHHETETEVNMEGYIESVLQCSDPRSQVLLTDLDHSAIISQMSKMEPKGRRTGTPMFISLDVAGASRILDSPNVVPLESLERDQRWLSTGGLKTCSMCSNA